MAWVIAWADCPKAADRPRSRPVEFCAVLRSCPRDQAAIWFLRASAIERSSDVEACSPWYSITSASPLALRAGDWSRSGSRRCRLHTRRQEGLPSPCGAARTCSRPQRCQGDYLLAAGFIPRASSCGRALRFVAGCHWLCQCSVGVDARVTWKLVRRGIERPRRARSRCAKVRSTTTTQRHEGGFCLGGPRLGNRRESLGALLQLFQSWRGRSAFANPG